jgi:hypothetical protein
MSVEAPEFVILPEPEEGKGSVTEAARRKLSSPWAVLVVVIITVLWTIPTVG